MMLFLRLTLLSITLPGACSIWAYAKLRAQMPREWKAIGRCSRDRESYTDSALVLKLRGLGKIVFRIALLRRLFVVAAILLMSKFIFSSSHCLVTSASSHPSLRFLSLDLYIITSSHRYHSYTSRHLSLSSLPMADSPPFCRRCSEKATAAFNKLNAR